MFVVEESTLVLQVERILHSEEFRNCEVLRRLLKFLAEKSASGEADQLKEYSVAIDGLGKPSSYDPRQNSAVRIQVGRLRQKLAEYYRNEGRDDEFTVDLPKGRFRLICEPRLLTTKSGLAPHLSLTVDRPFFPKTVPPDPSSVRRHTIFAWSGWLLAILGGLYIAVHWYMQTSQPVLAVAWTSDLNDLWHPFLSSKHPIVLAIEDPLFVELKSEPGIYYRDKALNRWSEILESGNLNALRSSLGNPTMKPSRYYTAYGEVNVSFMLGRLVGSREPNFTISKTSQTSWQDLAANNILFVGVQNRFFDEQLRGMPLEPALVAEENGVRNVRPRSGEPTTFSDDFATAPDEEGTAYALVSHLPGPQRGTDIESFTSNRSAGYVAAVQWFVEPSLARVLVAELKKSTGGEMPRYYQVLFKVRFRDDVPTESNIIMTRELH
jgi:hypothetical protein